MPGIARATVTCVTLGAPDPRALARFYRDLLDLTVTEDSPEWVVLRDPQSRFRIAFQAEPLQERPVWPGVAGQQQMMAHLEIRVDDLDEAEARARELGAVRADFQPQPDVRVCLDPVGRPFCLYLDDAPEDSPSPPFAPVSWGGDTGT